MKKALFGKNSVDMLNGPIFRGILKVAIPIMVMNIMQLMFNAADVAILGIFVNDTAVAAVGTNGALISLITGLFIGIAAGANVIVAKYIGQNKPERIEKAIGSSILIAFLGGVLVTIVGVSLAGTFLKWMKCDENVIGLATKYLRIYFLGAPVMFVYNFCAQIMRAKGDAIRPMIYLIVSGVVNVILNVVFVLAFNTDVEGVAIATIVSQALSATLAIIALSKDKGIVRLRVSRLKFYKEEIMDLLKVGVPSGLQSCMFAVGNIFIQSAINQMGELAMAGVTISNQFDGILYFLIYAPALAAMSFVSQNYGANNIERIKKIVIESIKIVLLFGIVVGFLFFIFAEPLCYLITDTPEVVALAKERMAVLTTTYFLAGILDTFSYALRGMGKPFVSMMVTLVFCCIFRIAWIYLVFPINQSLTFLTLAWPISWILATIVDVIIFLSTYKKLKIKQKLS